MRALEPLTRQSLASSRRRSGRCDGHIATGLQVANDQYRHRSKMREPVAR